MHLPSTIDRNRTQFWTSTPTTSQACGRYRPSPSDFINSFYAVLKRWQSETAFSSDPDEITSHPSYRVLVENAEIVTPLIIESLRDRPSRLVWVLDDAFDETPYGPSDIGNLVAMTDAWVSWAERNGRAI